MSEHWFLLEGNWSQRTCFLETFGAKNLKKALVLLDARNVFGCLVQDVRGAVRAERRHKVEEARGQISRRGVTGNRI